MKIKKMKNGLAFQAIIFVFMKKKSRLFLKEIQSTDIVSIQKMMSNC